VPCSLKKLIYSHNNQIQLTARETGFIGFLKMLQDVPLGQAYSQVRHYSGGGGYPNKFLIGFAQISWMAPEDSGVDSNLQPPVSSLLKLIQVSNTYSVISD